MTNMLIKAIEIALCFHGRQLDKAGMPYILHPLHVMDKVNGIEAKIVAVLHDTVEDTNLTLEALANAGFDDTIVNAIDAISKRKGETNEDYWTRVKSNKLALQVKLVDIAHNSSEERLAALSDEQATYLRDKYAKAKAFLLA